MSAVRAKAASRPPRRPGAPFVLAIGGFDPSCGAGVVADARSIEAMGAMPLAVATAMTVQSGRGLRSSSALPPARVAAQLDRLLADLPVAAFKIGQVPTAAVARLLAARLASQARPLVLDPVVEASGGGRLATAAAAAATARLLLPLATLVTVNLDEASALCGRRLRGLAGLRRAAAELEERGAAAVLVKGGHLRGEPVDVLRRRGRSVELRAARIPTTMHGTGCALASAVAARLALGDGLEPAVRAARRHVRDLLRAAARVGTHGLRGTRAH